MYTAGRSSRRADTWLGPGCRGGAVLRPGVLRSPIHVLTDESIEHRELHAAAVALRRSLQKLLCGRERVVDTLSRMERDSAAARLRHDWDMPAIRRIEQCQVDPDASGRDTCGSWLPLARWPQNWRSAEIPSAGPAAAGPSSKRAAMHFRPASQAPRANPKPSNNDPGPRIAKTPSCAFWLPKEPAARTLPTTPHGLHMTTPNQARGVNWPLATCVIALGCVRRTSMGRWAVVRGPWRAGSRRR